MITTKQLLLGHYRTVKRAYLAQPRNSPEAIEVFNELHEELRILVKLLKIIDNEKTTT